MPQSNLPNLHPYQSTRGTSTTPAWNSSIFALRLFCLFKADKAVVGFVPTNLQVRRNVKTKPVRRKPTKPVSKVKEAAIESDEAPKPATKAVADDYDDLMTEINSLK